MNGWPHWGKLPNEANDAHSGNNRDDLDILFVVDFRQSGFGLETLKLDMAKRCLDRLPSKISN